MKDDLRYLGFNDFIYRLIGIPLIGFNMPFVFFGHTLHDPWQELAGAWTISIVMSIFYWEGARRFMIYWRKRMPEFDRTVSRIALMLGSILLYSVIIEQFLGMIFSFIFDFQNREHPISGFAGTYLIILLVSAIYEAVFLYQQWKGAILEQERVKQEHIRSQLEGLRNQVNPHFLFNSLNTLMSIVAEDQQMAIKYLQRMSKVFRYVLDNRTEQLITLETELEFIENYVFLQKERFQENLKVEIVLDPEVKQYKIVPLSLQLLFENAIKHNIVSAKKPLNIKLYVNDAGKLVVENNFQPKNQVMHSTKVGLENIKNRYRFFTEEMVDVENTDAYFRVAIPLIKLEKEGSTLGVFS